MERQFFSGNTLEQAILAAARHYGLDPSRVAYRLRDKKHGFVNIRRRVVIEVDPEDPELAEGAQIESPATAAGAPETQARRGTYESQDHQRPVTRDQHSVRDSEDRGSWQGEESSWSGEDREDRESEALKRAVEELSEVVGIRLETSIQQDEEGYEVDLSGPDSELLLEDRGAALGAIEHLLPRMVRGLNGRGVPCRVDSGGFRATHEQELRSLALEAAEAVSREQRGRSLEPMNPADRRQVHLALAEESAVRTESEGQGFMKRVRIFPS